MKPAIHRFPGAMAKRVQELLRAMDEYDGYAEQVWTEAEDALQTSAAGSERSRLREMRSPASVGAVSAGVDAAARAGPSVPQRRGLAPGTRGLPGRGARPQAGPSRAVQTT